MSMSWLPLYHGDYLRDTGDLSCCEHGVYLLLLMRFFAQGPLENDIDRLCRIAAGADAGVVVRVLERYWELAEGKWTNRRMAEVKAEQQLVYEKKSAGGKKGAAIRWGEKQCLEHSSEQCLEHESMGVPLGVPLGVGIATRTRTRTISRPRRERATFVAPSPHEVAEYAQGLGYSGWDQEAVKFVAFYGAKGWMIGKSPMKDWKAAVVGWQARRKAEAKSATSREVFS